MYIIKKEQLLSFVEKELASATLFVDREYILRPIHMRLTEGMEADMHLVVENNEIIGFAEYFIDKEGERRVLTLIRMYVAQGYRKKGYGSGMLKHLIETTKPDECGAWVMSDEAAVMFKKEGFIFDYDSEVDLWAYKKLQTQMS